MVAIAISSCASDDTAVVLLVTSLSKSQVITGLKNLLEASSVSKAMHDVHRAAFWLDNFGLQSPKLVNCIDLQLLFENTTDKTVLNATVLQIANCYSPDSAAKFGQTTHSILAEMDASQTSARLSKTMQQSLTHTAQLYAGLLCKLSVSRQ